MVHIKQKASHISLLELEHLLASVLLRLPLTFRLIHFRFVHLIPSSMMANTREPRTPHDR